MARAPDRWPVTRAALIEAWRAALARLRRSTRWPASVRIPDRLLFAPQDLRAVDPAVADDMASGVFTFGDRTVVMPGVSPFVIEPPTEAWAADLYGFGWLRHLRAADTGRARDLARAIVGDALSRRRRDVDRGTAREPEVAARRLTAFLAHSPLVLSSADHGFYGAFLRRIGQDMATLGRAMRDAPKPTDRLAAAIAVCFASLCCAGFERRLRSASRALSVELEAQVLADGGHVGRNPDMVLRLLLDLLPLRLLYATRSVETPPALDRAIDRMMPMLRFFRIGGGDLVHMNGMGRTPFGELAAILAQDKAGTAPAGHAAASGYDRLEAGGTTIMVETGAAPPLPVSGTAHAGCLSFEMASGTHLLVVNCGAPPNPGADRDMARSTAAHSTLGLAGESSAYPLRPSPAQHEGWGPDFLAHRFGPILLGGPHRVSADRETAEDGALVLSTRHDGYLASFGATHRRRLRLSADGGELEGEDRLDYEPGVQDTSRAAALRFHLDPAIRAEAEAGGGGICLETPSGERWRFGAEGVRPRLEDSVVFSVSEGRRRTRQIVVDLPPVGGGLQTACRWIFLRA